MAKFYGNIGYVKNEQTEPGIWEETAIERKYYGNIIRNASHYQMSNSVNDDISISNNISIIADPYACENFQHMRYVVFMNAKWKITNVELSYPRINLTIGGLYNGE